MKAACLSEPMVRLALATALAAWLGILPAQADNAMGYRLLSPQEAAGLPHNHGALGLDVERSQQIDEGGLSFDIIRVKQVRPGSPGGKAGLRPGDQIIAIDGRVFPSLAVFAAYVGAMSPGSQATVDYIPAGGGPGQAQRVPIAIGPPQPASVAPESGGLSTGTKVAIGVGAAALLGCYELGCFSHRAPPQAMPPQAAQPQAGQPAR